MKYLRLKNSLKNEYKNALETVEAYGLILDIDKSILDDKMMELCDLLLTAQQKSISIENIIGNDINIFTQNYFSDITVYDKFKFTFKKLYYYILFVFLFEIIDFLLILTEKNNIFSIKSNIANYIIIGIVISILSIIIRKFMIKVLFLKFKKIFQKIYYVLISAFCILSFYISYILYDKFYFYVPTIYLLSYISVYILFYSIILIYKYLKNKPTNESKKFLKELDLITKDIEILNLMITIHEVRNTRRRKKGKEPYSIKEYMEKERKSSNSPIYFAMFFICILILVVPSALDVIRSETIIDFLIFLSLQIIIIVPVLWFNILSPKATINCINRILKRCSEMNIDLYEYKKIVCKEEVEENDNEIIVDDTL